MKTIGLLGGISWISTAKYYRVINETVKHCLGKDNSAKILMYSVNFEEIESLRKRNDWEEISKILTVAALNIEKGGADFLLICSNTMHKIANEIQHSINIPLLHSAEAITESNGQSLTDDGQAIKSEEVTSEAAKQEIATKDEKEMGQDGEETLEEQVEEVRKTFLALQEVCKANDIEGYLEFWDDETKMEVDGRDLDIDQRRERRRESLAKRPGMLQEIANLTIESIGVDTSQAEKVEEFFGTEIKGIMMLVRTDGRAFLFHETVKGWKLFTIAPAEYFR